MRFKKTILLISLFADFASPQSNCGQTPRAYSCVLQGYCNDWTSIDIRIQTPQNNPSPQPPATGCSGNYIVCRNIKCGISTVQPNPNSGPATPGSYPWHVFLQDATQANNLGTRGYIGGGILINQYWVLTAAHKVACVGSINAIMGIHLLTDIANLAKQRSYVCVKNIHPLYSSSCAPNNNPYPSLKNDIALLRLENPINLGEDTNILCLPPAGSNFQGQNCVVPGFGQTSFETFNAPFTPLKQAYVPIVQTTVCSARLSAIGLNISYYFDPQNEICAGGQPDIDACTGDGGSGLVCKNTDGTYSAVGIVIWGKNCGKADTYGVYTNIASHIPWINSIITSTSSGK